MGPSRSVSTQVKRFVHAALQSVVVRSGLGAGLVTRRQQLDEHTEQIQRTRALMDAISSQLEDVAKEVDAMCGMVRDQNLSQLQVQRSLSKLSDTVGSLGERVQAEHRAISELERRVDRSAGSILDATALSRRLERIEDRILGGER